MVDAVLLLVKFIDRIIVRAYWFLGQSSGSAHQSYRRSKSQSKPTALVAIEQYHRAYAGSDQNSNRSANCISRGVPDPTGVIGETMLVFTVLRTLPNPVVFSGLKTACGCPSCG